MGQAVNDDFETLYKVKDEIRDLIIELKDLIKVVNRIWRDLEVE